MLLGGDDGSISLGNELDGSRDELSQGDSIEKCRRKKIMVKEGGGNRPFYSSQPVCGSIRWEENLKVRVSCSACFLIFLVARPTRRLA